MSQLSETKQRRPSQLEQNSNAVDQKGKKSEMTKLASVNSGQSFKAQPRDSSDPPIQIKPHKMSVKLTTESEPNSVRQDITYDSSDPTAIFYPEVPSEHVASYAAMGNV